MVDFLIFCYFVLSKTTYNPTDMSRKLIWILATVMTGTVVWMIIIQSQWFRTSFALRQEQFYGQVMNTLTSVVDALDEQEVVTHLTKEFHTLTNDSVPGFDATETYQERHVMWYKAMEDTVGTILVQSQDSMYYQMTDTADGRPLFKRNEGLSGEQLQGEIRKRVQHNKTVFLEKVVNQLIRKQVNLEDRISLPKIYDLLKQKLAQTGIYSDFQFAILREDRQIFESTADYLPVPDDVHLFTIELFPDDILSDKSYLSVYFPDEAKISQTSLSKNTITSIILMLIIMSIFLVTLLIIYRQKKLHEVKTDFINNMTHELKTPIASISLASQMLKDPAVSGNQGSFSNLSNVIEDECKRLGFQVERVLQMASLERGKTPLKIKDIYINDIIKKVSQSVQLKLRDKGGVIACKYGAKDDLVEADEVHITNVINNLLDNAIKYTENKPELKISTANVKNGVEITIADNGIGISREDQKHVFEQFFRVHTGNVHNVKGFGIGLSYVKKILEAHNGSVKLKSELGKGSTFTIFLPFAQ